MAKYERVKAHIYQKIESGAWPEDHPVTSENALAAQFQVSRMTARRALQELADEGLIIRMRGSGSFVASLKSQSSLLTIRNIADEIQFRQHNHTAEVIWIKLTKANPTLATLLHVPPETPVWHSIIIHYEDDDPVQVEDRYVNPTLVPDYGHQDFTQITPHEYLCEVTPLTEASHQVEAVLPTEQIKKWLKLDKPEACLQIQRRTWSREGVVSQATLTHPGSTFRLGGHFTFRPSRKPKEKTNDR